MGATATDAVDGSVPVNISGTVDINIAGTYVITYSASDSRGNTSSATRTVIVNDIEPPIITLNGASRVEIHQFDQYEELGAYGVYVLFRTFI